ncbi:hypothetical protein ACWCL1_08840 [Ligilactobacillus sp. LYQ135]
MAHDLNLKTATIIFLPCGCVEYPDFGITAMGEIKSEDDFKMIAKLLNDKV